MSSWITILFGCHLGHLMGSDSIGNPTKLLEYQVGALPNKTQKSILFCQFSRIDKITNTWSPTHDHLHMITSTWSPTHDHLHMITYTWSPTHDHLHMITYTWSPIHDHLHMITYTWSPPHDHLHMITYTWSPTHDHLTAEVFKQYLIYRFKFFLWLTIIRLGLARTIQLKQRT